MVSFSQVALALLLLPLASGNPTGCITEVEDRDYFDAKVEPIESAHWTISYHNTYKIVTNTAAGESYLLYQCGTDPPADQLNAGHASIVPIPLENVGVLYTTMIPFLELLGARMNIAAFFGFASWVSSPCLSDLLDQGLVETVTDPSNATLITNVDLDLPSFVGHSGDLAFTQTFRVSLSEEDENLAAFEWIKFYSVFFNLEAKANEIFDDTRQRYECAEENAGLLFCGDTKPVVLWGAYSAFCGGWSVARCPNYYCEFAEACSATLLNTTEGSISACGSTYMTIEEFVAFGKDADYWIYTSPDVENTLTVFADELSEFVSVQNQEVYDTEGRGGNAWFEQRLAEPDIVLQDFCDIVGFENPASFHQRAWLRNVFTEPQGSLGVCEDASAPLVPPITNCVVVSADICAEGNGGDSTPDGEMSDGETPPGGNDGDMSDGETPPSGSDGEMPDGEEPPLGSGSPDGEVGTDGDGEDNVSSGDPVIDGNDGDGEDTDSSYSIHVGFAFVLGAVVSMIFAH